ncbi:Inositol polyphosphate multikinase [Leucoagaricus sp. SymC.cos]|nr:Inositol polyphosphate multikinase [Leucoagaricus sp. SymC.cos]
MSAIDHLATIALSTQVGGHAGVLTTEDGELLIKPALPRELEFYQKLQSDEKLATLLPFAPKFLGTLRLEGEVDDTKSQEGGVAVKPLLSIQSIVLENISYPFSRPNIMDIKLGTVLYDDGASPEKVERMIKRARETTSLETGIRLTGFQVHDNVTGQAVITPKSYGKSIKVADLPEGIAKFFPVGKLVTESLTDCSCGLPATLLRPILQGIRGDIQEIRDIFAELELRMVGGSLLIMYEGDWGKAREVKLIDFAHTKVVPGEGPDKGVLLGMDTVLKLLDGRLESLA